VLPKKKKKEQYDKGLRELSERAPNVQNWNDLSDKINSTVLD
jgi:hypothetical protein